MANGNNNNQNVRSYMKEFAELLPAVVAKRALFDDFFAGGVEALDGIRDNAVAFTVKTSDVPIVANTYSKDANVAFGEGTGKSSRFGDRQEIVYVDTDVPYTWEYAWHEGIDRATVNNDMEAAIADRMELQAQFKADKFAERYSKFISEAAGKTVEGDVSAAGITAVFGELHKWFVNNHVVGTPVAKVTPGVYDAIVEADLMTTSKGSTVNIDRETVDMCKGFVIEEYPEDAFQDGECVYAYVPNIAKTFTGIVTARTIESEDFDGVAFQGHGKAGEFIPEDNKVAVAKVKAATDPGA